MMLTVTGCFKEEKSSKKRPVSFYGQSQTGTGHILSGKIDSQDKMTDRPDIPPEQKPPSPADLLTYINKRREKRKIHALQHVFPEKGITFAV